MNRVFGYFEKIIGLRIASCSSLEQPQGSCYPR
jgi:hypothetical protein